jgi:RNA polymerase sigma-70 factor (ECF subfamily)
VHESRREKSELEQQNKLASFEATVLPHLDAAYNLARWLLHNKADAEDVAQEAVLRAFRFFGSFRGGDGRPWLLTIVRNTCYSYLQKNRSHELSLPIEDELFDVQSQDPSPEARLIQIDSSEILMKALEQLPVETREIIVLRELEEMSYKEIAEIAGVPIGTVMSRLARGRKRLQELLNRTMRAEV